jgi:hypothetical protein
VHSSRRSIPQACQPTRRSHGVHPQHASRIAVALDRASACDSGSRQPGHCAVWRWAQVQSPAACEAPRLLQGERFPFHRQYSGPSDRSDPYVARVDAVHQCIDDMMARLDLSRPHGATPSGLPVRLSDPRTLTHAQASVAPIGSLARRRHQFLHPALERAKVGISWRSVDAV